MDGRKVSNEYPVVVVVVVGQRFDDDNDYNRRLAGRTVAATKKLGGALYDSPTRFRKISVKTNT